MILTGTTVPVKNSGVPAPGQEVEAASSSSPRHEAEEEAQLEPMKEAAWGQALSHRISQAQHKAPGGRQAVLPNTSIQISG